MGPCVCPESRRAGNAWHRLARAHGRSAVSGRARVSPKILYLIAGHELGGVSNVMRRLGVHHSCAWSLYRERVCPARHRGAKALTMSYWSLTCEERDHASTPSPGAPG